MKKVGIAILGFGTVGGGTYQILRERAEALKKEEDLQVEVKVILVRNVKKAIDNGVPQGLICTDIYEVATNPEINIVAECIGGIEPAKSYIIEALKAGKNVVTANKELLSKHWSELEEIAAKNGVGLYFEATCAGGVPIIRTMTQAMQANNIIEIKGIINGTTNYILSRMSAEGADYESVLKDAQALGFAEANPVADVEGFDAAYKLSILSSLAFKKHIPVGKIYREGISKITSEDIAYGKEFGYTIKLLAIAKKSAKGIEARVHPVFIANEHPLASVNGSFNAVFLVGDSVGDIMLYGRGAGALPTGSAVVSDIIFCAKQAQAERFDFIATSGENDIIDNFESEYYIKVNAYDKSGVLAKIAAIFAENNVSITSMQQRAEKELVPIVFITHKTGEQNIFAAVKAIEALKDDVECVQNVIRVER